MSHKRGRLTVEESEPLESPAGPKTPIVSTPLDDVKRRVREEQEKRTLAKVEELRNPKSRLSMTPVAPPTNSVPPTPSPVPPPKPVSFIQQFSTFVLDCDGVLWHGETPIPGASEALQLLSIPNVHFVTNNSTTSRHDVSLKLSRVLGIHNVPESQITTSGSAAAQMFKHMFPNARQAFVVGECGLRNELTLANIAISSCDSDTVDVVVFGLDTKFTYEKLTLVSNILQRCRQLMVTNMDAFDRTQHGGTEPGCGALVSALLASLPEPPNRLIVCGKPNGALLQDIALTRQWNMASTLMIGDRVDMDIEFANNAGIKSCLVLTGVSKVPSDRATHVSPSLLALVTE